MRSAGRSQGVSRGSHVRYGPRIHFSGPLLGATLGGAVGLSRTAVGPTVKQTDGSPPRAGTDPNPGDSSPGSPHDRESGCQALRRMGRRAK